MFIPANLKTDILAEFAWEPSDTVSIPRDTILRFRSGKGSLLVPEGCSVNYTDSEIGRAHV